MAHEHEHEHEHDRGNGRGGERTDRDRGDRRDDEITIVVNGREKAVEKKGELTFDQLVALAFDDPPTGEFICFTITYRRGPGGNPVGTLVEGEIVKVKDGMIFNVTATDKS